jgi:hypothetical protein
MSYATEKIKAGRRPLTVVELYLDYCQLVYGVSPCTAAVGVTGSRKCFNTAATCQDFPNYDPAAKVYRFCTPLTVYPENLNAIPSLKNEQFAPTKIEVEGGIGQRESVTVTFQDHSYHDRGVDKYWRERSTSSIGVLSVDGADGVLSVDGADEVLQVNSSAADILPSGENLPGTYWGRLKARNPYYVGRELKILTGYVETGVAFDPANFVVKTYLIESISGPTLNGTVTVKAKDALRLADDKRSQAPRLSTGRLQAGIDENDTTLTLVPAGVGDLEYPATGFVRLGSEIMSFTRVGDAMTVVRAQRGTDADEQDANDLVQLCLVYAAETVDTICNDLIVNYTPISSSYIPLAAWATEVATYLTRTYSTLISEPTSVLELLQEVCQSAGFSLFWDARSSEIVMRALRAPSSDFVLTDSANFLDGRIGVEEKPDLRVSQGMVFSNLVNFVEYSDDPKRFRQSAVYADIDLEGPFKFGQPSIKRIFSRWIASRVVGEERAQQIATLFGETPRELTFSLDAKDSNLWTGDTFLFQTRLVQDDIGGYPILAAQITEATEAESGHKFDYKAQSFSVTPIPPVGDVITISVNTNDVDLLALYTAVRGAPPTATTVVTFVIEPGVIVGQDAQATGAMRVNVWPIGAIISLENNGRVQGKGGMGATVITPPPPASPGGVYASGENGGTALFVENAINISNFGEIWGGGGGGGGRYVYSVGVAQFIAGGGGAGTLPGEGGTGFSPVLPAGQADGEDGTSTAGGDGGNLNTEGKEGGGPGLPGDPGLAPGSPGAYAPGAAGYYVVGNSLVNWLTTGDDRRGLVS